MTQPGQFRVFPRLGLKGWAVVILWLSLLAAVLITFTLIAFGIFLFLLPVFVIMTLLYILFPRMRGAQRRREQKTTIIDGEYRIVERDSSEEGR